MKEKMSAHEFEKVYEKYKTILYRIAFTYVKNKEDAEDILQEAFTKCFLSAPEFESEEYEKRWLIRITVNLSKNHLKMFWNRNKVPLAEFLEEAEWNLDESERNILEEVFALPDKCKVAMYLHYYEGYTCKEIAEILRCTESAVKMRLKRGREMLKMSLENEN